MSKVVTTQQIIGERGVLAIRKYCNEHIPYLIFREENVHDYGIDGEIELTAKNELGKIEPTGEILKVQVKSTLTGSYIKNIKDDSFEFHAQKEDFEYWSKHSLAVVLVIYDAKNEVLYAKKVNNSDYATSTNRQPILFGKRENQLIIGDNSFTTKFSANFKSRINFDVEELIATNIFKFSKLPQFLYHFKTKVQRPKEVYDNLDQSQFPSFIIKDNSIYVYVNPDKFQSFKEFTIENKSTKVEFDYFKKYLDDPTRRNYCIELLNKSFKDYAFSKEIYFNKDFKRYYFGIKEGEAERSIKYNTRKNRLLPRTVVKYYEYIVTKFYRHFGFELNYFYNDEGLFLEINPKYLYTKDGREVLDNRKKITELTSYIKRNEHNPQMLNHVHFIYAYLSGRDRNIVIMNYGGVAIELSKYIQIKVPFGISSDSKKSSDVLDDSIQPSLFDDHED